jgi:hypothetical protein
MHSFRCWPVKQTRQCQQNQGEQEPVLKLKRAVFEKVEKLEKMKARENE